MFDYIDLFTLTLVSQTCHSMDLKVRNYLTQKYEHCAFNLIAYNNEWSNIFPFFGQYFHEMNIEIPSSAFLAEPYLFGCVNKFCTNLVKLSIKHGGCFDIISPDFTLPKLEKFKYENICGGDIEVGMFAHCPTLKRIELFWPDRNQSECT